MRSELLRLFAVSGLLLTTACGSPAQENQTPVRPFFSSQIFPVEGNPNQVIAYDRAQIEAVGIYCGGIQYSPQDDFRVLITTKIPNCTDELKKYEPYRETYAQALLGDTDR